VRARKVCRKPDCPHLRPCPEPGHEPKAWEGSDRRKRLPSNWEAIRRRILLRDPICTICNDALSTEVHHLGDSDDHRDQMLAGVCSNCHGRESSRQGREAKS
jgi:5-methylcytosine-specific restriction protein A